RLERKLPLEPLEPRHLLALSADVVDDIVTFTGDGTANSLFLRENGGNLEWSTDNTTFSADLDTDLQGIQTRMLSQLTSIVVSLGGEDDLLSVDHDGAFPPIFYDGGNEGTAGDTATLTDNGEHTWAIVATQPLALAVD